MSRTIVTCEELWREWTEGLGPHPSVQALDDQYGTAWRLQDGQWHSRRRRIINFIRTESQRLQITAVQAVQRLDSLRTRAKWSLHQLSKAVSSNKISLS